MLTVCKPFEGSAVYIVLVLTHSLSGLGSSVGVLNQLPILHLFHLLVFSSPCFSSFCWFIVFVVVVVVVKPFAVVQQCFSVKDACVLNLPS